MFTLLWILAAGLSGCLLITVLVWSHARYAWLQRLVSTLVILYPFEFTPTLDIGPATLKPSFIVTMCGIWLIFILLLKRDKELLNTQIRPFAWWVALFAIAMLPSYFIAENPVRFWTTLVATFGAMASSLIIVHFVRNPFQDAKRLTITMLFVCVFAAYQFAGDMLGLPTSVTLLREQYTKVIFGFPRMHATALEPLLFAGQLFFPIAFLWNVISSHTKIWTLPHQLWNWIKHIPFLGKKLWSWENTSSGFSQSLALGFVGAIFVLTISKGGYLAIAIAFPIMLIIGMKHLDFRPLLRASIAVGIIAAMFLGVASTQSASIAQAVEKVYGNFAATLYGTSGSIGERQAFQDVAWLLVEDYPLTGVGSGNFADTGAHLLPQFAKVNPGSLIVNNVYLEIFVEFGVFALAVFLACIAWTALRSWQLLQSQTSSSNAYILVLSLTGALLAYLIQWSSFSPLYITPIFILTGLLVASFDKQF